MESPASPPPTMAMFLSLGRSSPEDATRLSKRRPPVLLQARTVVISNDSARAIHAEMNTDKFIKPLIERLLSTVPHGVALSSLVFVRFLRAARRVNSTIDFSVETDDA